MKYLVLLPGAIIFASAASCSRPANDGDRSNDGAGSSVDSVSNVDGGIGDSHSTVQVSFSGGIMADRLCSSGQLLV